MSDEEYEREKVEIEVHLGSHDGVITEGGGILEVWFPYEKIDEVA